MDYDQISQKKTVNFQSSFAYRNIREAAGHALRLNLSSFYNRKIRVLLNLKPHILGSENDNCFADLDMARIPWIKVQDTCSFRYLQDSGSRWG